MVQRKCSTAPIKQPKESTDGLTGARRTTAALERLKILQSLGPSASLSPFANTWYLKQLDVARVIGVTNSPIWNWESDQWRPEDARWRGKPQTWLNANAPRLSLKRPIEWTLNRTYPSNLEPGPALDWGRRGQFVRKPPL